MPTFTVRDPHPGQVRPEPVELVLPGHRAGPLVRVVTRSGHEGVAQRVASQDDESRFVVVLPLDGDTEVEIGDTLGDADAAAHGGIRELPAREADAFRRLDTGALDLELCRGTAQGTGASKWGLRHFASTAEGRDLLPSGNNAIGGFYGPFFTPENGLINPPEHVVADIEVLVEGPVLHRYRLSGVVPDGLRPELRGKRFEIDWTFFHGVPWFERTYRVDHFETVVNGRSVTGKITVGDEFESGQGSVVFDRYDTPGGVRYRDGDPYALLLVEQVDAALGAETPRSEKFEQFRALLDGDMEAAHWDLYWRLFCAWEGALEREELEERLALVRRAAHVAADDPSARPWRISPDAVDVPSTPDATIFPGAADVSVELSTETGQAMVWWTSQPSGAFQIVQRRQSGWVNWGTNGENECPELPVGTTVRTAYGPYADSWRTVAAQLARRPEVERLS